MYSPKEIQRLENLDRTLIWHPFTQMKEYIAENAPIIAAGEGCYLTDIRGRRYLDGVSSLWVTVHGHRTPAIDHAIRDQLGRIAQYWQNSGRTGKRRFLSFYNAYHGDTLGAVGVGGIELFHHVYGPLVVASIKTPSAYCYRCPYGQEPEACSRECFASVARAMEEHREELAAVIIEPIIQGAAGMLTWPRGFLSHLRQLCDKHGVLLVADEVATGFGRTGKMFACEHENVSPDIMVVAKGITGGYLPLAATLTTDTIYNAFFDDYLEKKTFYHGHTYTGNPLACAAALANLSLFEQEAVLDRLQPKIAKLRRLLEDFKDLPHVGDIRQAGFMVGIELVRDKKTKEPFPPARRTGRRVILKAREKGIIIRPLDDVVVLMPPLSIEESEIEKLCDAVVQSIREVTG